MVLDLGAVTDSNGKTREQQKREMLISLKELVLVCLLHNLQMLLVSINAYS